MGINLLINKDSIVTKITLFFIAVVVIIHTIIFIGYDITKQQQIDLIVTKYMKSLRKVHEQFLPPPFQPPKNEELFMQKPPMKPPMRMLPEISTEELNQYLNQFDLSVAKIDYESLKQRGNLIAKDHIWELYELEGYHYFYESDGINHRIIKDEMKLSSKTSSLIILTVLLNILLLSFYIYLINKLKPLQTLRKKIIRFSKGEFNISTATNGKDEISIVSNEFDKAIKELKLLQDSRNLFLRNIMHELKTPITKGALIADMMPDTKYKQTLNRAFLRLQYLLHEFAKIEQLTSNNLKIETKHYRMIDLIDQAIDILLVDREEIEFDIQYNLVVDVDFQLFSIALKNLIDNGLKYSKEKVKIVIVDKKLEIKSIGQPLQKELHEYLKPFNREYENSNQSLGLGLYIVHNILKAHNLQLQYEYQDGMNNFYIQF